MQRGPIVNRDQINWTRQCRASVSLVRSTIADEAVFEKSALDTRLSSTPVYLITFTHPTVQPSV